MKRAAITKAQLREAIESGQIHHVYQPIIDLRDRTLSGVEALLRWDHPTIGLLGPDLFLHEIHSHRLWTEVTDLTLRNASGAIAAIRDAHGADVTLAVNLSSQQLQDPATANLFAAFHADHPDLVNNLVAEVVEDLSWVDLALGAATVEALRDCGVSVFLDDFGTGAGTLSMLTELSYDGLKIDRHFVSRVTIPGPARSIVEAIVGYAQSAEIELIAEGVEDDVTLQTLVDLGCHLVQGYALGAPQRLDDLLYQPAAEPRPNQTEVVVETKGVSEFRSRIEAEVEVLAGADVDALMARVARLEADAKRLSPPERDEVLLEIGERATLAALYAGDHYLGIEWGMQASRTADSLGLPGRSAAVLSMVATLLPSADQDQLGAARALAQTLHLRMAHNFGPIEGITVDNNLGSILANMGLVFEAIPWWRSALAGAESTDCRSGAISAINLSGVGLDFLEGLAPDLPDVPEASWRDEVLRAIAVLDSSAFTPTGVSAATSARLAVFDREFDVAERHLATVTGHSLTSSISQFSVTRSRALLARGRGEHQKFVAHTTHLLEIVHAGAPVELHRDRAETLHTEALVASGQHVAAVAFLSACLRRHREHASLNQRALFEWLRSGVQMDRRYSAVYDFLSAGSRTPGPP